ncbi:PPA1309 family protein [Arcanobacterium hippocoleae]|uniref:Uncharacterized protein n=1 Tax=Arcanobacterium hippocoleae TaxID=149017 RepID=A0ABU1T334_9ACTO|nr:PPA1309 family protein [Arcanobacterium hippocoleae]MDR6939255.1 hypothetical protein [Arcanobacterium hippocoleae]
MNDSNDPALSPQTQALRDATIEIEQYVAKAGWDAPIRIFALVNVQKALAANPELAKELSADENLAATHLATAHTLFSVEQEGLPAADSITELLGQIYWPADVDGVAISVERVILPPSAEVELPTDEQAAMKILQAHPQRQDVRMVAALMRDGATWGALRMRDHDRDELVLSGAELLSGLCAALEVTFTQLPEAENPEK